jgi:uncharacterized protein
MIVDFRSDLPTWEGVGAAYLTPPARHEGYETTFATAYSLEEEDVILARPQFLALLDDASIDVVLIVGRDARDTYGSYLPDESITEYAAGEPRIRGLAGANPHRLQESLEGIETAVVQLGFLGVNVSPWEQELPASDRAYYPLYEKCLELDIPIVLHTGINYGRGTRMEFGHPRELDAIACDLPGLKVVAAHGGWPWVAETVAVALRHPTVYIELSGVRPRYLAVPGSGWEVLLQFGNTLLRDRILFGTDWPLMPFKRTVEETCALPLKPGVAEKWLGLNAARLLGLEGGP